MNKLNTLDEYLFRLINSTGLTNMDDYYDNDIIKMDMDSFIFFILYKIYSKIYTQKIFIKYYFL